jgi:hypothetical protein
MCFDNVGGRPAAAPAGSAAAGLRRLHVEHIVLVSAAQIAAATWRARRRAAC